MKLSLKFLAGLIIVFSLINLFIFINRNKGFEYKKISSQKELYLGDINESYESKWAGPNKAFNQAELDQGLTLLKQKLGIDTILDEQSKTISIAGWLYNSFYRQIGRPDDSMVKHPLQQYFYLSDHKEKRLWCGNFQTMLGFFCTVVKLPNRYVEIAPISEKQNQDTHEVNEVYLKTINKWVMIDATRNLLLTRKDTLIFSAADYLDHRLQKKPTALFVVGIDTVSIPQKFISEKKNIPDKYFNKEHFLRYYYTMDLAKAYAPLQKIKRYFLRNPWYEIYDPTQKHSNFFFRVKQFFLFGMAILLIFFLYKLSQRSKINDRRRKTV